MKTENHLLNMATKRFFMIAGLLVGLANLSGCITNKVLDLRKEHETRVKEATNFWSLSAVRSAHTVPNGEVFVCVEFRDSPSDEPQAYTINLMQTSRIGRTFADLMPAIYGRTEGPQSPEAQTDMVWYLYPLPEAQKGCNSGAGKSPFPATALKIETVHMHREDQSRLPGILLSSSSGPTDEARIIEVSFASDTQGGGTEPESKKWLVAGPSGAKDVLLVYLPAGSSEEHVRALGIAGAFEPGSEWVNPYSLLVVPAIAADTAIITTIILLGSMRYR